MSLIRKAFQRLHYPTEIIAQCVRWYLTYSLSLRDLEEIMAERCIDVDHATLHPCPLTVTLDKSGSNRKAVDSFNAGFSRYKPVTVRQNKYLNNRIEQDHRFIKRRTRAMQGFKTFRSAQILLSGIELMHMFRKKQFNINGKSASPASLGSVPAEGEMTP